MRKSILSLIIASITTAYAKGPTTEQLQFLEHIPGTNESQPYKLTKVISITITKPSYKFDDEAIDDCSTFRMTPKLVHYVFKHAEIQYPTKRMHDLDTASACRAAGTVKFANGDEGTWLIWGGGTLALGLAKSAYKEPVVYLVCRKCESMADYW